MTHQKTVLSLALAGALGVSAAAEADVITGAWSGTFTMIAPTGVVFAQTDVGDCYPGMLAGPSSCIRTAVSGTMTFDTVSGAGSASLVPFSFCGSGDVSNVAINLQEIGDGYGGAGPLILGNMTFNWNTASGIPVSMVWDASGLFSAIGGGLSVGQTITGGALPASNNTEWLSNDSVPGGTTYPIGPALLAMTIYNTTTIPGTILGTNPSGTLPFVTDTVVDVTNGDAGVGGSPMPTIPFKGYNVNLDILSIQVTNIEAVPLPAAAWLFGSGLAGLIGVARRKRRGR